MIQTINGKEMEVGKLIRWKKINSNVINETFTVAETDREAITRFLTLKGGWDRVDIVSIHDYCREAKINVTKPILSTDKSGIIYKMKNE